MTATQKLSRAQETTLRTFNRLGGELNCYAGTPGVYSHSLPVLVRLGLLERLGYCACMFDSGEPCDKEHAELVGHKGGQWMYDRHCLTAAGRAWLAANR